MLPDLGLFVLWLTLGHRPLQKAGNQTDQVSEYPPPLVSVQAGNCPNFGAACLLRHAEMLAHKPKLLVDIGGVDLP